MNTVSHISKLTSSGTLRQGSGFRLPTDQSLRAANEAQRETILNSLVERLKITPTEEQANTIINFIIQSQESGLLPKGKGECATLSEKTRRFLLSSLVSIES